MPASKKDKNYINIIRFGINNSEELTKKLKKLKN